MLGEDKVRGVRQSDEGWLNNVPVFFLEFGDEKRKNEKKKGNEFITTAGQKPLRTRHVTTILRGTIIIRTCDGRKKQYIPLFLLTIVGPDYYVPR